LLPREAGGTRTGENMDRRRWDIFLNVVDNYGDVGVCWRLAVQLAARGAAVRLFVDDADPRVREILAWLAPGGDPRIALCAQPAGGAAAGSAAGSSYDVPDVVISAFGSDLPEAVAAALIAPAGGAGRPVRCEWIVLEYLSAEAYAGRSHGLDSPVPGIAAGAHLRKRFFFPGFTPGTGGLLREPELLRREQAFDRRRWLQERGILWRGETLASVFCYEPPALAEWLADPGQGARHLLVTAGRASDSVRAALAAVGTIENLRITYLPHLSQTEFDHLLWSADVNLVRGEDSLVRGIWAGKPLIWQAYPQDGQAHASKVEALLDWLAPPPALRRFWRIWNGLDAGPLPAIDVASWGAAVLGARARLLAQDDLVTQLVRLVAESR
jgi:uncharacterized repeat protein (TIGR03837 family)